MNYLRFSQRLSVVLIAVLGIAFFYAAYSTINNIVAEQSRIQQQALSPVYKLVRDELLRPLYIAETFASSVNFTTLMNADDIDEAQLLERLAQMERDLELVFFVASEKARRQYFSSGRTLDLIEGEVWWYFEAMEQDKEFMADLGQVGDVHLFFDVKMYSENREFLGYVGVGKRIQRFLDTFDQYKSRYGYDFLFVNDQNEIILSSLPDLVVTNASIPTLASLDWFDPDILSQGSLDSELIDVDGRNFLVSEFGIEELDWQLLLLVPLEARQGQITRAFVSNALSALVIVMLLLGTVSALLLFYKRKLEKTTEVDALSGLPNRAYVERRYDQLRRTGTELCVIIADLDHFKRINDTYGHPTGDKVLQAAAATLKQGLREMDIVGRWGGEEFVMLIPAKKIEMGGLVAERARASLEALQVEEQGSRVSVTGSFGVACGSAGEQSLNDLLASADRALYEAKSAGRNRVKLYEGD